MSSSTTELHSQMIMPPLQYGILYQGLDENMKTTYEKICTSTNREGCNSPMLLARGEGQMNDRLPTPVQDIPEPLYSSLLKDSHWKMGETHDINQNPEILNKIEDISEKMDELRTNIERPRCGCKDITSNRFSPARCYGSDLSEDFAWGDKYTHVDPDSVDTDERYTVKCSNGFDYTVHTDKKQLVYNCTGQQWETKGPKRSDPFQSYGFSNGKIHCDSGEEEVEDEPSVSVVAATGDSEILDDGLSDSDEAMTSIDEEFTPMVLESEGYKNSSPKPCSENWFLKIFDDDDCKSRPTPSQTSKITIAEVITWIVLLFLSIFSGYLIYKGGGNIPLYVAGLTVVVTIYIIIRFAL